MGNDFYEYGGDGRSGKLEFGIGETSKTLRFYLVNDRVDEFDEHFLLELTSPIGAEFDGADASLFATGWLLEEGAPGANRAIAVSDPVVVEGSASTVAFTVSLSAAFATTTNLSFATFDGSAVAGADYVARSGQLSFAAGQLETTVLVNLVNGRAAEAAETFGLRVSGSGATLGTTGLATILDTDAAEPVVSIEGDWNGEGEYVNFVVRLSEASTDAVTVDYRTVNGTAFSGTDFYEYGGDGNRGVLTIAAGETSKTLRFYAVSDRIDEIDETFSVQLTQATGAGFGAGSQTAAASGWLLDDDGPGLNRAVSVTGGTVLERVAPSLRTAAFDVELSRAATTRLEFDYATVDGTAVAGRDYRAKSGTVVFEVGQTRATVLVDVFYDTARETAETFSLRLDTPFPSAISASLAGAFGTATIVDGTILGTIGDDRLTGTELADRIEGQDGDDTLTGLDGADRLYGGGDRDRLYGGDDADRLYGGRGSDRLDGGRGADDMEGGSGNDVYLVDSSGDAVIEARNGGKDSIATSLSYRLGRNVENLTLTGSADRNGAGNELANVLKGNGGDNTLKGADGNDRLYGGSGEDVLFGGDGRDLLDGRRGADRMAGELGGDTYFVDDKADRVIEKNVAGADTVQALVHFALGANVENLTLAGKANLRGAGNGLDNVLRGNAGNNALNGGGGDDVIRGGDGRDTIIGSRGVDVLFGGDDADRFVFRSANEAVAGRSRDVIRDFERGLDHIDLRDIDADTGRRGKQDLDFIGSARFSDTAGELRFSNEVLQGDIDGDGRAEFQIDLTDLAVLRSGDLLL